jgi:hypothetical protein
VLGYHSYSINVTSKGTPMLHYYENDPNSEPILLIHLESA